MEKRKIDLFNDKELVKKIQVKLPQLFYLAELESSRAGKIGMEVGSLRERIIVALLIYKYGESNVECDIPITKSEIDVIVNNIPISIKTISSNKIAGIKLIWTVDSISANHFYEIYEPSCDMIYIHINWNSLGALYYIPTFVQNEVFESVTRNEYIKLPKQCTNPRGVEITTKAMNLLVNHNKTYKISVEWKKELINYNAYEKWIELWKQN